MWSSLYILITTGFALLIWIQRCYSHWNRVRIDTDIPWILKINKSIKTFHIWNTSQKEKVIQNAMLPSIQSHSQIAAERMGLLIISILDLKYLISEVKTNVKCTQLQGVLRLMIYLFIELIVLIIHRCFQSSHELTFIW